LAIKIPKIAKEDCPRKGRKKKKREEKFDHPRRFIPPRRRETRSTRCCGAGGVLPDAACCGERYIFICGQASAPSGSRHDVAPRIMRET